MKVEPSGSAKQLSNRVRPGVFDVSASRLRLASALISDDLPTFERPTTVTSAGDSGSRSSRSADSTKRSSSGPAIRRISHTGGEGHAFVPGGHAFVPGGHAFVPGGHAFVPGVGLRP